MKKRLKCAQKVRYIGKINFGTIKVGRSRLRYICTEGSGREVVTLWSTRPYQAERYREVKKRLKYAQQKTLVQLAPRRA